MSTKREQILSAVKSALVGVSGVADASVYRSRVAALGRGEYPAVVVEPISDQADNPNVHRLEWLLTFQVAVMVRADNPEPTGDASIGSIHSKIMGDATIQGLVSNLVPARVDFQFHDADKPLYIALMKFNASYQTDLNTI
jgi:hypothetical protein